MPFLRTSSAAAAILSNDAYLNFGIVNVCLILRSEFPCRQTSEKVKRVGTHSAWLGGSTRPETQTQTQSYFKLGRFLVGSYKSAIGVAYRFVAGNYNPRDQMLWFNARYTVFGPAQMIFFAMLIGWVYNENFKHLGHDTFRSLAALFICAS